MMYQILFAQVQEKFKVEFCIGLEWMSTPTGTGRLWVYDDIGFLKWTPYCHSKGCY